MKECLTFKNLCSFITSMQLIQEKISPKKILASHLSVVILRLFMFGLQFGHFFYSTEISLQQRLEYLARAILSAKSSTAISSIAADGEFLHELEEKMEVRKTVR